MLPSQALILLLCHLDDDLVIILFIHNIFIYSVVHMTYKPYLWGHYFSHGTPVWPWPVITIRNKLYTRSSHSGCYNFIDGVEASDCILWLAVMRCIISHTFMTLANVHMYTIDQLQLDALSIQKRLHRFRRSLLPSRRLLLLTCSCPILRRAPRAHM